MNFNELMKEKIKGFGGERKKLLLHSCCAPCSSAVIEKLAPHFDITILYYNPNIMPLEEYEKRKDEQIKFLEKIGVKSFEIAYSHDDFLSAISGKENLGERSPRCYECYKLRIFKTAEVANKNGFEIFCTTLSV